VTDAWHEGLPELLLGQPEIVAWLALEDREGREEDDSDDPIGRAHAA
jgi:hypothetical protein